MTDRPRATLYRCTSRELAEKLPDRPDIVFTAPPFWRPRKAEDREVFRVGREATRDAYLLAWHRQMGPWLETAKVLIVLGEHPLTPIGCFGTLAVEDSARAILPWIVAHAPMMWWLVREREEPRFRHNAMALLALVTFAEDTESFLQHGITDPSVAKVLLETVVTADSTVIDPFMGSGEHLIAALKLGARHVYGSEPSDFIFQTAVERLKDFADVETP